jgi:endo-1,4-beta-xylanase
MTVRGHNLVWVAHNPKWLVSSSQGMDAAALEAVMAEHIAAVGAHYRGRVYSWDVVNEAMVDVPKVHTCTSWDCALKGKAHGAHWPSTGDAVDWTVIGTDYIEKSFRYARQADPKARLFYNEYAVHGDTAKANYTLMLLQHLLDVGAPLDGIGIQMHIDNSSPNKVFDAAQFAAVLSRYAALGLEIHITELNVKPSDPIYQGKDMPAQLQAQGELYAAVLTACRAQPKCKSFETWGFADAHSSLGTSGLAPPGAFYFDDAYVAKPLHAAVAAALA